MTHAVARAMCLQDAIGFVYSEEWADDLLSRIFAVLTNLDSPEGGGEHSSHAGGGHEDGSSFLIDDNSMFRPLVELLFARLPTTLRHRAIKKTSDFLLGNAFASVAAEAAILPNAMGWSDPEAAGQYLLIPLIGTLLSDCISIVESGLQITPSHSPSAPLSKVQETTLNWRLGLLSSIGYHTGSQIANNSDKIIKILQILLKCPSSSVQNSAARALSSLMTGLCCYYPMQQYVGYPVRNEYGTLLDPFVDKFGEWDLRQSGLAAPSNPRWHIPTESEIALANELLDMFLVVPSKEIMEFSKVKETPNKNYLRALLLSMEGCIEGSRSCLPDFEYLWTPPEEDKVCVVGCLGVTIGYSGLREQAVQSWLLADSMLEGGDVESLTIFLRMIDTTLSVGSGEFHSSDASAAAWVSDDKWLQQPSVSGFMNGNEVNWRRRRPRWVAIEKVFMNLEWRASQAAYRWFASSKQPVLPIDALPKLYLDALRVTIKHMVTGVATIRDLASMIVERAQKRYPSLSGSICAPICAGIAKLEDSLELSAGLEAPSLVPKLLEAAKQSPELAAKATASGVPGMFSV